MRIYLYSIFGIISALIGWGISQFFWLDLGLEKFFTQGSIRPPSEIIVMPIVAAFLAAGMVSTEVFVSNPTRYKANIRVLPPYFWLAIASGGISGLIAGAIYWILSITPLPDALVRIAAWGLIGFFIGLGESVSWRFRSIEGATSKAQQRIRKGILFGAIAGLVAGTLAELIRMSGNQLSGYQVPIQFLVLGLSLGLFLSLAASPSYQVALRAGEGFEIVHANQITNNKDRPRLQSDVLRFVTEDDDWEIIEEGLSIQLPNNTKAAINVGSASEADIYIPNLPSECASLQIMSREVVIKCLTPGSVQINRKKMNRPGEKLKLKHNQILTFYNPENPDKFYRFVFYDRFLDPQA
ncbi:MAG: hypothetical protein V7L13_07435 [Nostoc sp.]|uniref:hypothetical protein n=1 Tax=Nostoc sp. TaxID=1180 RepID=UPI002FF64BE5